MILFKHLAASLSRPTFWTYSGWLDIVTKYRRSRLGILWMLVPAIIYIWGLSAYFSASQRIVVADFAAYVGIGFLLFRLLMTCINDSTGIFASQQAFILDGQVRLTDYVLLVMARSFFYFLIGLPVLAVALWLASGVSLVGLALTVVTMPLLILNILWIGVVFSLLGARYSDVQELTGSLFIFGFVLTPIIWHADQVPVGSLQFRLMQLNPLYHLIEMVRAPILGGVVHPSTYVYVAVMTVFGWIVATMAYRRYAKFVPLWL